MKKLGTAIVGKSTADFCSDGDNLGMFYKLISEGNFKVEKALMRKTFPCNLKI